MKSSSIFILLCTILFIDFVVAGLFLSAALHLIEMVNWDGLNTPYFKHAIHDILFGLGFVILLLPTYLFSLPIMGIASDQWGRKPLLSLAVASGIFGYLGILGGLFSHSLLIIILGTLIYGISGTDLPLIMAMVTDISLPQQRAKYFTIIQAIILMYVVAGQLEDYFFQSQWGNSINLPAHIIIVIIIMQLISFILVRYLPETIKQKSINPNLSTEEILDRKMKLFSVSGIKSLLVYLVMTYFLWGLHSQSDDVFTKEILHWSTSDAQLLFIIEYILIFIGLLITYFLIKNFDDRNILLLGIGLSSIGYLGDSLFPYSFTYIIFEFFLNFGALLTIVLCWTLLSYKGEKQQGLLMSLLQLAWAVGWMISGMCAVFLQKNSASSPFHITAVVGVIFLASVVWYEVVNKKFVLSKEI